MISFTNNNIIDKEKVIKLKDENKIKNKEILLLSQKHENDLKELNFDIEILK